MSSELPPEGPPPPSYAQATGSSQASSSRPSNLELPGSSSAHIPLSARRSMEDEARPLPDGWVRQFDADHSHQFFVDTKAKPPRSIWHHPFDDDEYLATLPSEERERMQEQDRKYRAAMDAESTDEEAPTPSKPSSSSKPPVSSAGAATAAAGSSSSAQGSSSQQQDKPKLGRRLKDKITGTTHEQRVAERAQREKEERAAYEQHMKARAALARAVQTGEPQLLGRDKDGREVYIEPPNYGGGYGYPSGARGVNPYSQGVYANPNARFVRPPAPYGRPGYGYGYGYGYGRPGYGGGYGYGGSGAGLGLGAGLLGGALLGGLLF